MRPIATQPSFGRDVTDDQWKSLTLVTYIAVLVPNQKQEVEAQGQERGAKQVSQRRQVRDRETVRVLPRLPHDVDHPVCYTQQ